MRFEYKYRANHKQSVGVIEVFGEDILTVDHQVDVYYFKKSGKYYARATFHCYIPAFKTDRGIITPDHYALQDIMMDLHKKDKAPGLTGCSSFAVTVIPRGSGIPFHISSIPSFN